MKTRPVAPAVDAAVTMLAARLDELRATKSLDAEDRKELFAITALLAEVEAKQATADVARANILLQALIGKKDVDKLPPYIREQALLVLTGGDPKQLEAVEDDIDREE